MRGRTTCTTALCLLLAAVSSGLSLEDKAAYKACQTDPSTCILLCAADTARRAPGRLHVCSGAPPSSSSMPRPRWSARQPTAHTVPRTECAHLAPNVLQYAPIRAADGHPPDRARTALRAHAPVTATGPPRFARAQRPANTCPPHHPNTMPCTYPTRCRRVEANSFVGTIPTELGLLTALSLLYLNTNKLVGTIPTVLGHMTALESMYLTHNSLSGSIPTEFGRMTALRWIL